MYAQNAAVPIRFWIIIGMMVLMLMPFAVQTSFAQSNGKTEVIPGSVLVQPGTCVDDVVTPATVSVPSDTAEDGIFYRITQPGEDGAFVVHAQVGDDYRFGNLDGTGWRLDNQWNAYWEATAPVPSCDGPVQDAGEEPEAGADSPGLGTFALPQDCGSIPYPAPTGADVTTAIGFSNYAITQNGVVFTSGPISLTSPTEELNLSFDWASVGAVKAGQYFSFVGPLDTNGNKVFASATQFFPVYNADGSHQAGCATVINGDITVQFTEYVNALTSVDGRISVDLVMAASYSEESSTVNFSFDDESNFSIEVPGTPSGAFAKRGWFERPDQGLVENLGSVGWQLHVPANPAGYSNLILHDYAPSDGSWTFSCAGANPTQVTMVALDGRGRPAAVDYTEDCSATQMSLTIPAVPGGVSIDFYFTADITPGAEGPFYNVATAQADEMDIIELPYEVLRTIGSGNLDGDLAVTPIPPAIDHATCVDEVWVPASVSLPAEQEGVTYSMTPNPFPAEGGELTVIATLDPGYAWASDAAVNGWVLDEANNSMVYRATVTNDPCVVSTETPPPPVETPTPEDPCIPPPPEECVPPPGSEGTPEPCETPTIPAWCLTPTPPTVTELPETGVEGTDSGANSILLAAAAVAGMSVIGAIAFQRERI